MKKLKLIEKCCICSFLILVVLQAVIFSGECNDIENSVVRMHVIANSDSDNDQRIKLEVRDEVVKAGAALIENSKSKEEAMRILSENTSYLQNIADKTLSQNNSGYTAKVCLEKTYFPTREYEDISLPAGVYDSLLVKLGSAKGHNFWCVMFPSMCLPAAESDQKLSDVLSQNEYNMVKGEPQYKVQWKAAEIFEKVRDWIRERSS